MQAAKERMTFVLECIADGKIQVAGYENANPSSLDGVILPLSDVSDGSLKKGDALPFGEKGQAKVEAVGTGEHDGHILYTVKLTYPQ